MTVYYLADKRDEGNKRKRRREERKEGRKEERMDGCNGIVRKREQKE